MAAPENTAVVATRIGATFPERNPEISSLCAMLNPTLVPAPPIFVYGPSASGKMSICVSALSQQRIPYARILCSGYSHRKQLFRAVYSAALCALLPEKASLKASSSRSSVVRKSRVGKNLKIYSISGLSQALKVLLASVATEEGVRVKLYLLVGSLYSCNSYEPGLAYKLLHLSSTVAPELRVVAISREHGKLPHGCFILRFSAYSDLQLHKILLLRAESDIFGGRSSYSTQVRKTEFISLMKDALPRLFPVTRHLGELWSSLLILWKQHDEMQAETEPDAGSSTAQKQGNKILERTQRMVNTIRSRPVVNLTLKAANSSQPQVDRPVSFADMRVGDWASTLPVSTRFLLVVSVCMCIPTLIISYTLCNAPIHTSQAAYIASKNPSDSDHTTLGIGTKGRKRKINAGMTDTDGNDEEESLLCSRWLAIYR